MFFFYLFVLIVEGGILPQSYFSLRLTENDKKPYERVDS